MDESIKKQIELAESSDAYLITITRREGDVLKHFQTHTFDFYYKDLLPSINEIKKLILGEYRHLEDAS